MADSSTNAVKNERNSTLDVAKGISILLMTITHLVIFSHHPTLRVFNANVLLVFKMPLFIFISGYLFSEKRTVREFAAGKFDGLVKPVVSILCLSAVVAAVWWFATGGGISGVFGHTFHVLARYYIPLWFPLTLFLSLVVFRMLIALNKGGKYYALPVIIAVALLFTIITRSGVNTFILEFHAMLHFLVFLLIGYLMRKRDALERLLNIGSFLAFTAIFVAAILLRRYLNVHLDLNTNTFGNFIPTIIASFSGIIMVINISRWLSKVRYVSSVFILCSRSSFYILAFCMLLGNSIIYPLVARFLPVNILTEMLCFVLTISACIALYKATFHTRYLKYLLLPLKSFRQGGDAKKGAAVRA